MPAGTTGTKVRPNMCANQVSKMAVPSDDASTTVCPRRKHPLHVEHRNRERASRRLRCRVGFVRQVEVNASLQQMTIREPYGFLAESPDCIDIPCEEDAYDVHCANQPRG